MGFNMKQHKARTNGCAIDLDGQTLNVRYRPGAFTPELEEEAQRLSNEKDTISAGFVKMCLELLEEWDAYDGDPNDPDSTIIPIDEKTLKGIPTASLARIVIEIGKDANPQKANVTV